MLFIKKACICKTSTLVLHNHYSGSYKEFSEKSQEKLQSMLATFRTLCIDIFKTLSNVNHSFEEEIFKLRMANRTARDKCKLDLETLNSNHVRSGRKSVGYVAVKVWNSLPFVSC